MEDHFNGKYVNDDKYPAAKLKENFTNKIDFKTPKIYKDVVVNGKYEFSWSNKATNSSSSSSSSRYKSK